jgi:hypothetical protein
LKETSARDRSGQRQQKAHPQRRLILLGYQTTAISRFHVCSSGAMDYKLLRQDKPVLPTQSTVEQGVFE